MATQSLWQIGSDPACDIVISGAGVERLHCKLTRMPAGFQLIDLGTQAGTFVNGIRLTGPILVTPRDSLTIGRSIPIPWSRITADKAEPAARKPHRQALHPFWGATRAATWSSIRRPFRDDTQAFDVQRQG